VDAKVSAKVEAFKAKADAAEVRAHGGRRCRFVSGGGAAPAHARFACRVVVLHSVCASSDASERGRVPSAQAAAAEPKSGGGFPRALLAAVVVAAAAGAAVVLGGGAKGSAPSAAAPAKQAKPSWRK
jgi:hypothetical protein